ncbi:MAG: beta-ketoacyl synthase chain length factor [Bacteroidetes bacterium]|nr:beta-ketoacyl synthase chain length factor [Bacteroidota bacterium]
MFIHQSSCISPQSTFGNIDLDTLIAPENNILKVVEPKYENIPLNILRRMGKAVRIGVGAALPLIEKANKLDGIIIGSANGGMEDCVKFLNQIIEYDEGRLTPTNFVQSTPNAIAAQIGLTTANKGYNITHVHRGLAFENALLDAMMMLKENNDATYLLGGVDEVSSYNYNLERLGGWYKKEKITGVDLYNSQTNGSIAGEGSAMFVVNNESAGSFLEVKAIKMLHTNDSAEVAAQLNHFNDVNGPHNAWLSGENGDVRVQPFYQACENNLTGDMAILHFKHFTGEHPSTTALALWLANRFFETKKIPSHFFKSTPAEKPIGSILLYNSGKGEQHSFLSLRAVEH